MAFVEVSVILYLTRVHKAMSAMIIITHAEPHCRLLFYLQSNIVRYLSSEGRTLTEGEQKIADVLKSQFPQATFLNVEDISGKLFTILKVIPNCQS